MKKMKTSELTMMALMAAVMCILGPLSIPLAGGVPIALNGFAIFLTAYLLGCKKATISFVVYLIIGAVGLPVFSNYGAGFAKLVGPTGGYLVGYIFMAAIAGAFAENKNNSILIAVIGMVIGSVTDMAFGTAWYMISGGVPFMKALMACVVPFLPGNAVKIAAAAIVGVQVEKRLVKAGIILKKNLEEKS